MRVGPDGGRQRRASKRPDTGVRTHLIHVSHDPRPDGASATIAVIAAAAFLAVAACGQQRLPPVSPIPSTADTLPATVVQRFVDAANARDIAAMAALVAPGAIFARFPDGRVIAQSRDSIHAFYARRLPGRSSGFRITVERRIVEGHLVVDQELFTGTPDERGQATWMYHVRGGLIERAWVLDGRAQPSP